jgi:hypothetical protein
LMMNQKQIKCQTSTICIYMIFYFISALWAHFRQKIGPFLFFFLFLRPCAPGRQQFGKRLSFPTLSPSQSWERG